MRRSFARYARDGFSLSAGALTAPAASPSGRSACSPRRRRRRRARGLHHLHARYRRQGYAREGAAAVRDWAFCSGPTYHVDRAHPRGQRGLAGGRARARHDPGSSRDAPRDRSRRLACRPSLTCAVGTRLPPSESDGGQTMLYWALCFLVLAIIAGIFGFGGVAVPRRHRQAAVRGLLGGAGDQRDLRLHPPRSVAAGGSAVVFVDEAKTACRPPMSRPTVAQMGAPRRTGRSTRWRRRRAPAHAGVCQRHRQQREREDRHHHERDPTSPTGGA